MKRREFLKAPALGMMIPAAVPLVWDMATLGHGEGPRPAAKMQEGAGEKFHQRLHQDFSTYYPGIEYFLLGNGDIIAALQFCPERTGERVPTYVGLTLMDAERFGRKWSTFLFHPENGFARTGLSVSFAGKGYGLTPESFSAIAWEYPDNVPVVALTWSAGSIGVEEEFFVPSEGHLLVRKVTLTNDGSEAADVTLGLMLVPNFALFDDIGTDENARTVNASGFTSMKMSCLDEGSRTSGRYEISVSARPIRPNDQYVVRFIYALNGDERLVTAETYATMWKSTVQYWSSRPLLATGNETLDHLYNVSRTGLRALTARSGKRDSGLWMYNMEWVRDDVMMTLGMLHAGFSAEAKILLTKILEKSVGPDGRTIESSRWYGYDYTELDQNGQLLYGIWAYLSWTGDLEFVKKYWHKVRAAGNFPLQDIFRDKVAGLLRNKREFWERNDSFGFEDGFELAYQFWVTMGLEKCAEVAAKVGDGETAQQWTRAAESIRKAMFNDPKFRFIEEGHLIKRRTRDGRWQRYAVPTNRNAMPPGSPAATEERPECEPDTADVYPIIFDMVDPHSDLARNTLQWLEQLWSQRWSFGGYSRYNTFSEPDPPAPWPIATLLMARAYVEAGDSEKVWRALQWLATIHGGKSGGWFERYGPSITPPAPPVCVVGWTWSEVVMLIVHHVIGLRPDLEAITLRPHLIYGVDTIRKHFRVGGTELDIAIYRTTDRPYALVDGARAEVKDGGLRILRSRLRKQSTIEMCV